MGPDRYKNIGKKYSHKNTLIYSCQYHVVWCTKYRRKLLELPIQGRLKELVLQKQKQFGYEVMEIEVMPDHVHLLVSVDPEYGICRTVQKIKGFTGRILRQEFKDLRSRIPTLWTRSKFISSCGSVTLKIVRQYIEDQKGI